MNRTHLVTSIIGAVLLVFTWLVVTPLLLDLGDSNGGAAAFGWIVLVMATVLVGYIMLRPVRPHAPPTVTGTRPRRGSESQRRPSRRRPRRRR